MPTNVRESLDVMTKQKQTTLGMFLGFYLLMFHVFSINLGDLILTSQVHRTQEKNLRECLKKLRQLLLDAVEVGNGGTTKLDKKIFKIRRNKSRNLYAGMQKRILTSLIFTRRRHLKKKAGLEDEQPINADKASTCIEPTCIPNPTVPSANPVNSIPTTTDVKVGQVDIKVPTTSDGTLSDKPTNANKQQILMESHQLFGLYSLRKLKPMKPIKVHGRITHTRCRNRCKGKTKIEGHK
eukprot:TRINITY_DN9537_c0_g1_i3.p1 TRINITY_DN9537_c0_g1~~TRINITY_DN9537_c0_g1_i3.p1  ORF type:complete len:238 (+),score=46.67 TRINITY_DN9537_c0_g1_i3:280-993(+)